MFLTLNLLVSVLLGSNLLGSGFLGSGLVGTDLLRSCLLGFFLLDSGYLTPQVASASLFLAQFFSKLNSPPGFGYLFFLNISSFLDFFI